MLAHLKIISTLGWFWTVLNFSRHNNSQYEPGSFLRLQCSDGCLGKPLGEMSNELSQHTNFGKTNQFWLSSSHRSFNHIFWVILQIEKNLFIALICTRYRRRFCNPNQSSITFSFAFLDLIAFLIRCNLIFGSIWPLSLITGNHHDETQICCWAWSR